jgi:Ala-tRNA(Pro) deacylase
MSIATNLKSFLERKAPRYETLPHKPTHSSIETADATHVPRHQLAKGVLVRDGDHYLLVVVPADYHVHLGMLHHYLGRDVGLATESEVAQLFPDCDPGAIPPVGAAYHLETLVDERLMEQPVVYLECGDHRNLVRLSGEDFAVLVADAEWVEVARPVSH